MASQFFSRADLEHALGGGNILVQLLHGDDPLVVDESLLDLVISSASGEMASYLININLSTVAEPYASALIAKSADIGAYYAWRYGARGQPIPDNISQDRDKAIAWAQDVGKKLATLGEKRPPGLSERVGVVDFDPNGTDVSITGFKRGGFR
jgi:hypothetical protein